MANILTETRTRRRGVLAPRPTLWAALREGEGLGEILIDFYNRVFDDPRLAPFFRNVTKDWVIQKQWSFLAELFTGEKIYFGDRPRNAHHWMVISDELFDYRESLMRGCLERYGLAPELISEWMEVEEVFRKQIVKDIPQPRKIGGQEQPLTGWEFLFIEISTVCDGCSKAISAGRRVATHRFHGTVYHEHCRPQGDEP